MLQFLIKYLSNKFMRNKKGFTLVELLVVIAIIGLLSTLAVVALGSARSKARDARRISDIKQVQTALELYFADLGVYPNPTSPIDPMGDTTTASRVLCDLTPTSDVGFADTETGCATVYMGQVPINFAQPDSIVDYVYTSISSGQSYTIDFQLEGTTGGITGTPATAQATPSGVKNL